MTYAAESIGADRSNYQPSDQTENDQAEYWAHIQGEPAATEGRNESPEDIQVWVGHVLNETDRTIEKAVVGNPGNPGDEDVQKDQDEIDAE